MLVTCTNCAARYAVDPLAIGPSGRTVECARCHHRWFQRVEGAPPDLVIRPPTHGVTAHLPAVIEPKPDFAWSRVLALAVAVVVLMAVAAFALRHEIMAMMSNEASAGHPVAVAAAPAAPRPAPAKMAMPEPAARAQLEIDFAASRIELIDGHYVVQGEIVNTGRATGSTSTLRLTFKKDNDVLGERSYSLVEGPIAPGARFAFRQTLDDPPSGTTDVVPAVE